MALALVAVMLSLGLARRGRACIARSSPGFLLILGIGRSSGPARPSLSHEPAHSSVSTRYDWASDLRVCTKDLVTVLVSVGLESPYAHRNARSSPRFLPMR